MINDFDWSSRRINLTFILHLTAAAYRVLTEMMYFQILHMAHRVQL